MTNKDLKDITERSVSYLFDCVYHKKSVTEERRDALNAELKKLTQEERDYVRSQAIEFFTNLKRDHERNLNKSRTM